MLIVVSCMGIPPTVYGWTDAFPIEVSKGETLTLNVGYLKGSGTGRIRFEVQFDRSGEIFPCIAELFSQGYCCIY